MICPLKRRVVSESRAFRARDSKGKGDAGEGGKDDRQVGDLWIWALFVVPFPQLFILFCLLWCAFVVVSLMHEYLLHFPSSPFQFYLNLFLGFLSRPLWRCVFSGPYLQVFLLVYEWDGLRIFPNSILFTMSLLLKGDSSYFFLWRKLGFYFPIPQQTPFEGFPLPFLFLIFFLVELTNILSLEMGWTMCLVLRRSSPVPLVDPLEVVPIRSLFRIWLGVYFYSYRVLMGASSLIYSPIRSLISTTKISLVVVVRVITPLLVISRWTLFRVATHFSFVGTSRHIFLYLFFSFEILSKRVWGSPSCSLLR